MTRAERGRRLAGVAAAAMLALALASPATAQWRGEGRGAARGEAYQDRGPRREGGGWGGGQRSSYDGRGYGAPAYRGPRYGAPLYGAPAYGGYDRAPRVGPPVGAGRAWRRGETLPDGYRGATVPDPGRYHLRRPPNGYDWVGDNRNAYLMQRSTGMVLDSVPGAYEPPPPYRGRRR